MRRRLMQPQASGNYTRVEYLENKGIQYIKLPLLSNEIDKVEIDCQQLMLSVGGPWNQIFGMWTSANGKFYISFDSYSPMSLIATYGKQNTIKYSIKGLETDRFKISLSNTKFIVNDVLVQEFYIDTLTLKQPMSIFGRYDGTNINISRSLRIFSFKGYFNDELKIDLIPVLDSKGKPAMYDLVSDTFLYNNGKGEFLYG